jgi:hypothetical protein
MVKNAYQAARRLNAIRFDAYALRGVSPMPGRRFFSGGQDAITR